MNEKQLPRLLFVGLGLFGTGFSRVLNSLLVRLADNYELHLYRLGGSDESLISKTLVQTHEGFTDFRDPDLGRMFKQVVVQVKPDIVFLFGQPWWLRPFLTELQPYRNSLLIVNYIPVEGKLIEQEACEAIGLADHCIAYTEFTRKNLISLCQSYQLTHTTFTPPQFHTLPHGVDTEVFYPVTSLESKNGTRLSRTDIRRQLFPDTPHLHDAFIVLNANHPYYRKRLDITLAGFAAFVKDKPSNVFLYLHHTSIGDYERKELRNMISDSGLNDRVLLNALNPTGKPLSEEKLNLLYNACDVGVTTSMGEGWGLASFEHGATGAAQIVPAHTSFIENWTGAADLLEIISAEALGNELTECYVPGSMDLALKLNRLYSNSDYLESMSGLAYKKATGIAYQWSGISIQLHEILQRILISAQTCP